MSLTSQRPELRDKLGKILECKSAHIQNPDFGLEFEMAKLPINLDEVIGTKRKILEIGSGWGEFTLQNAQLNLDHHIIALEKKKHRITQCIKDQKKQDIKNVFWMVVDVEWFFEELFTANQFDKIIINFPDPWPKKRHNKHRFISPQLIETLAVFAKPNAILEFATDFYAYMEETLFFLEASPHWHNMHSKGVILDKIAGRPQSFFEITKKNEGENTYFTQFKLEK